MYVHIDIINMHLHLLIYLHQSVNSDVASGLPQLRKRRYRRMQWEVMGRVDDFFPTFSKWCKGNYIIHEIIL